MLSLNGHVVVDLIQPLGPAATIWPGGFPLAIERENVWAKGGLYSRRVALEEHCGTHLDAPGHVREDAPFVDGLEAGALIPGSLIGFSAYAYALRTLPLSTVGTYAYVNPLVAVAAASLVLGEPLHLRTALASALIVAVAALIVSPPLRIPDRRGANR